MAFFLVDLQFRRRALQLLTRRELYFAVLFALFAVLNWNGLWSNLLDVWTPKNDNLEDAVQDGQQMGNLCNSKFHRSCVEGGENT